MYVVCKSHTGVSSQSRRLHALPYSESKRRVHRAGCCEAPGPRRNVWGLGGARPRDTHQVYIGIRGPRYR